MGTLMNTKTAFGGAALCATGPREATERGIHAQNLPPAVFWTIVVVLIVAVVLIIAIPMYKGYKKEMEKPVKKSGSKTTTKKK